MGCIWLLLLSNKDINQKKSMISRDKSLIHVILRKLYNPLGNQSLEKQSQAQILERIKSRSSSL